MQVILIRHAHAEWPNYHGADFERPLTERGLAEARTSARAISDAGHRPTLLLASPARRTRQTAEILAEEFQLPVSAVRFIDSLYNASAGTLASELGQAAAPTGITVLVAHNPGISNLVREVANEPDAPPLKPAEWRAATLHATRSTTTP
jgi:phosphohistidine phosphatase